MASVNPRRFLLGKSGYDVSLFWLDDHGSCKHYDSEGSLYFTRFHPYRDEKGLLYARICPNGLEEKEWTRVFTDDPPGTWVRELTNYRNAPPKRSHTSEEGM